MNNTTVWASTTAASLPRVEVVHGDITRERVDAIVNAANAELEGGGGVDGAIHKAGGRSILAECREIVAQRGPLVGGEAVATTAGKLAARMVIHVAGPIWDDGKSGEPEHLAACYRSALELAIDRGAGSVSFPSISTGVYGYPFEAATRVAMEEVGKVLQPEGVGLLVRLVYFSRDEALEAAELAGDVLGAAED
jgi:O-acetyl-ADP-ribose deacetylase (regulator of RNase III)